MVHMLESGNAIARQILPNNASTYQSASAWMKNPPTFPSRNYTELCSTPYRIHSAARQLAQSSYLSHPSNNHQQSRKQHYILPRPRKKRGEKVLLKKTAQTRNQIPQWYSHPLSALAHAPHDAGSQSPSPSPYSPLQRHDPLFLWT